MQRGLTLPEGFTWLQDLNQPAHRQRQIRLVAALGGVLLGLDWLVGLRLFGLHGATAVIMLPVLLGLGLVR